MHKAPLITTLNAAMSLALGRERELHDRWNVVAMRMSDAGAPQIDQDDGRLDILLRHLEAELAATPSLQERMDILYGRQLVFSMSRHWVLSMYENIRTLQNRSERFSALYARFQLVRVPLAKGEIARDRSLKQPIELVRVPVLESDPEPVPYSASQKSFYRMPWTIDQTTGSLAWLPVDLSHPSYDNWISRRQLSDECLSLFD